MVVVEKIEEYYKKKEDRGNRDMSKIHVSSARKCPRKVYFQHKGFESKPMGARVMSIFDNGDAFHERMMRALYESGTEVISSETNIPENDLLLGRCDCIVSVDGQEYVVDFKSASSKSFYYIIEKDDDKETHVSQLNLYMHFFNIDKGILLYENKNTQERAEKVYEYDKKRAEKDLKKLYKLDKQIKNEEMPEVPSQEFLKFAEGRNGKVYRKCDYCNYREVCDEYE